MFKKSFVSPPCVLVPGCCQAARIETVLSRPVLRMTMTHEESEMKQLAYECQRALWRKAHPAREAGPGAEELDPEG